MKTKIFLMPKARKKCLQYGFLIVLSILFMLFAGEFSLRIYALFRYDWGLFSTKGQKQINYFDKKLGWKTTPNYQYHGSRRDASGILSEIDLRTNNQGFRLFGNPASQKLKMFVIGDSFTIAAEVSDNQTYYALIREQRPDIEIFAYGAGGYGSLQEYMILDSFIDTIQPDIILWQYCSNDFINNSYELEHSSYINNNTRCRPYLTLEGDTIYKNPKRVPMPQFLLDHSRLFFFLNGRLHKLFARLYGETHTVEKEIEKTENLHLGFKNAAQITRLIMNMVKIRADNIPIYTFAVDDRQPYYDEWKTIAQLEGLSFIDGIPQTIHEYELQNFVTRAADKVHWNAFGHRVAAEGIIEYFLEQKLVRVAEPQ